MGIKISPFSDNKSLHLGVHRVSFVELKVTSAVSNYSTANTSKNIPYIAYDYRTILNCLETCERQLSAPLLFITFAALLKVISMISCHVARISQKKSNISAMVYCRVTMFTWWFFHDLVISKVIFSCLKPFSYLVAMT